jgi:hypothetical protein
MSCLAPILVVRQIVTFPYSLLLFYPLTLWSIHPTAGVSVGAGSCIDDFSCFVLGGETNCYISILIVAILPTHILWSIHPTAGDSVGNGSCIGTESCTNLGGETNCFISILIIAILSAHILWSIHPIEGVSTGAWSCIGTKSCKGLGRETNCYISILIVAILSAHILWSIHPTANVGSDSCQGYNSCYNSFGTIGDCQWSVFYDSSLQTRHTTTHKLFYSCSM